MNHPNLVWNSHLMEIVLVVRVVFVVIEVEHEQHRMRSYACPEKWPPTNQIETVSYGPPDRNWRKQVGKKCFVPMTRRMSRSNIHDWRLSHIKNKPSNTNGLEDRPLWVANSILFAHALLKAKGSLSFFRHRHWSNLISWPVYCNVALEGSVKVNPAEVPTRAL